MSEILMKIAAGVLLVVLLVAGWNKHEDAVYQRGWDAAVDAGKAQRARDAAVALQNERALQEKFVEQSAQRFKEKQDYEKTIADIRIDARRGNSGMRVQGSCIPAATTPANPGAASGPGSQAGTVELVPEIAGSVLDAAVDLRQSVLDRNALIDLYNLARATCNAPGPAPQEISQ